MSSGETCPGCGETHLDYEQVDRYTVDGPYHAGVVEVHECDRCGEKIEGCRR